jgi:putative ATP-binding cassette transporter
VRHGTRLSGFTYGYQHVSTVFPALVVSPAYLASAITLGVLMEATLAFQRVEGAFAFFLNAYARLAEWKAVMDRLAQFKAAMETVDEKNSQNAKFDTATAPGRDLAIRDLTLRLPSGRSIASIPELNLAPAERLLVRGASGAGKSSLFRMLAGVWPSGEGQVRLPAGARVLALPQRPYFPLGTLRQALTYPTLAEAVPDADVREAMAACGLSHLAHRLDEEAEWSTELSGGEQQRVSFARALIHRPTILLLDDPVAALEDADADHLYRTIGEKLPDTMVISVGRSPALAGLHDRSLDLSEPRSLPLSTPPPATAPV